METTETNLQATTTDDGGSQPMLPRKRSRGQLVIAILAIVYLCSGLPGLAAGVAADPRHAWGLSAAYFGLTMTLAVLGLTGALHGRRSLFRMGTGAAMLIPSVVLVFPGLALSFPGLLHLHLAFTLTYDTDGLLVAGEVGVDAVPLVLFSVSQIFSRRPSAVMPPVAAAPNAGPRGKAPL